MKEKTENKIIGTILFIVLCFLLGAVAGLIIWVILKIIGILTHIIWDTLPAIFGINSGYTCDHLIFNIVVCLIGAIIIAGILHKWGKLPNTMEEVSEIYEKKGTYNYKKIPVYAISAMTPLIFGATLGPEAGLTGVIVALCCWVGDQLKTRFKSVAALFKKDYASTLTEVGLASVLSVVFFTPIAGLANNIEPQVDQKDKKEHVVSKGYKVVIYAFGVIGGLLTFKGLGILFDQIIASAFPNITLESGLPRFPFEMGFSFDQLIWLIPLIVLGILLACLYKLSDFSTLKLSSKILSGLNKGKKLSDYTKLSYKSLFIMTASAAVIMAVCGFFLPDAMFSGEHQLGPLMESFTESSAGILAITACVKIMLITVCFNLGWRGGLIFPIIYSGISLGFAASLIFGIEPYFAAAVTIGSTYAFINKKPVTVSALLLLVFPVSYIPVTLISAIASSFVAKGIDKLLQRSSSDKN